VDTFFLLPSASPAWRVSSDARRAGKLLYSAFLSTNTLQTLVFVGMIYIQEAPFIADCS